MESKSLFVARPRAVVLAAVTLLGGASTVLGQSLVSTSANVIAATDDLIPGSAAEMFGGTTTFDSPVLDDAGNVLFRARMVGGVTDTLNFRSFYFGATRASLQKIIQSADAEPSGTIPGGLLRTATAPGIGSGVRISGNGSHMLWGTSLYDGGVAITSSNDTAIFIGNPSGGWSVLVREGDLAAGTVGANFSSSFSSPSQQNTGVNNSGRVLFKSSLTGGDVSGTTNNEAWFTGVAGALELMRRKGDSIGTGEVIGGLGFLSQMNASGQVVVDGTLSTTVGAPVATAADNTIIELYTPGSGMQLLLREGSVAPGIPGGATFNIASNSWSVNTGSTTFNAAGELLINADISGPGVVSGIDDRAVYKLSTSGQALVVRRGDPAPGVVGGFFDAINNSSLQLNNAGTIAFQSSMTGSPLASDDTGIWIGTPGNWTLVVREGDVAPGTGGSTFGSTTGQIMRMNGAGQLLFNNSLLGGSNPGSSLWAWDPICGLQAVLVQGDQLEYAPGLFLTALNAGGIQFNNGDARPLGFADDGTVALNLSLAGSYGAIVTVQVGGCVPQPVAYCTAGTSSNGCVPVISGVGTPSVAASSGFTIDVANVEGAKQGLIFYGINGRASAAWGSGGNSFFCVKAPTQRMGAQNSGGTAGACDGAMSQDWLAYVAANPGSLGAPFNAGATVNVQAWYRDPAAVKTTNLSGGLEFVTAP